MPEITITEHEPLERALRRFKRQCERAGILSDIRHRRYYQKPSERRKRRLDAMRRRLRCLRTGG